MRTHTKVSLLAAAALALGGLGAVLHAAGPGADGGPGGAVLAPAPAPGGFRWDLPEGTRLVYDLAWSSTQRSPAMAPAKVDGELRLGGRLELRSHGRRGDAWLVEARLGARERRLVVVGHDVLAAPDALGDAVVWAELAADGTVGAVEVAPEASVVWRHLAPALLGQLEVVVPAAVTPADAWAATQRGPFGRGVVRYTRTAADTLVRVRAPYDVLDGVPGTPAEGSEAPRGEGRVRLGPGFVVGLEEHETLGVAGADGQSRFEGESSLRLTLVEHGRFTPDAGAATAARERLEPGARLGEDEAGRQALRARVEGLTAGELLAGVLAGDALPDEDRWMWRASGLLRLEPALCGRLARVFASGQLTREGRALVLDLLAGAGTPEAQAAMIAALGSAPAREHAQDFHRYLQRLSFLDAPTGDTTDFARRLRREAVAAGDTHGARAAAYVLGNLAGSAAAAGDEATARDLARDLAGDLALAGDPAERAALLTAYGAAKRPEAAEVAAAYVSDGDAQVRRAAVDALASAPGARAEALLGGLAGDGDAMVQESALAALGDRSLDGATLGGVARMAASGGLAPINDMALATFAVAQRQRGANIAALGPALAAAAARSGDPQVKALVRQALRR